MQGRGADHQLPTSWFSYFVGGHLPLFHNSCLRPLQLCYYCLVAPLRRPPHHSYSTRPMSPAQHRIFCWSLFFSFSPVSLIKPSLDQPGGSSSGFVPQQPGGLSSGFVSKQPGGILGFCSPLLLLSSRPASSGHCRPSSLEVFLRFCFPAAWRLILGFCSQAAWRFPRVLFASSVEDLLGFCFAHPQGSHPS